MSTTTILSTDNRPAVAAATVLERALDGEITLSVGSGRPDVHDLDALLPTADAEVIACVIAEPTGIVALAVSPRLVSAVVAATGGSLLDAVAPALADAIGALEETTGSSLGAESAMELSHEMFAPLDGSEVVVFDLLEGTDRLASLVIRLDPPATPGSVNAGAAPHEFQPLEAGIGIGIGNNPFDLLSDVEMGVTAELGRKRMTVRDLLSLTAGSVIELDRAAGSPVDVLVNGTIIARGEVVVIDEEFGIRISEIVGNGLDPKRAG
ncbi:MAG: flagellar motor switch protein FliN [Acidimicrobiia bacterium]